MAVALPLCGFFLGIGQPLTMTLTVRAAPVSARSTALALRLLAHRLGQVAVPTGAGLVAGATGAAGALWLAGGLLAGSAAAAADATRRGAFDDTDWSGGGSPVWTSTRHATSCARTTGRCSPPPAPTARRSSRRSSSGSTTTAPR